MEETTLNSAYPQLKNPRGVFIGTRGKRGEGANPGPKYGRGRTRTVAKTRQKPRAQRQAPRAVPSVPYRCQRPVSDFQPLVLTKQLSKVNGFIIGL